MLGRPKARDLDRPVFVSLDAVVPKDHCYRHLHRALDLSFVRGLAADCHATGGRPSIDPEAFFRLQLLMSCSGIRSERQLMEQVSYNLALRRGCPSGRAGYNLDEPLPDHSSLGRIRARLGLPVFRRSFEKIVARCIRAGLVRGDELIFDATNLPSGRPGQMHPWTRSSHASGCSRRSTWHSWSCRRHRRRCRRCMTRAGTSWRSVGSTPSAHRPMATGARATAR